MSDFRHEIEPPAALEDRVVAALQSRRLVTPRRRRLGVVFAATAAAILLTAAGYGLGRWHAERRTDVPVSGPEFMLLLHHTPALTASTVPVSERVELYRRWAQQVYAEGYAIRGNKLKDIPGHTLGGFFIVRAPSRKAVDAVAATCPHARLGGRIEIREIDPT
jgi:hypothetical protein